jgi:hypothetical protein
MLPLISLRNSDRTDHIDAFRSIVGEGWESPGNIETWLRRCALDAIVGNRTETDGHLIITREGLYK